MNMKWNQQTKFSHFWSYFVCYKHKSTYKFKSWLINCYWIAKWSNFHIFNANVWFYFIFYLFFATSCMSGVGIFSINFIFAFSFSWWTMSSWFWKWKFFLFPIRFLLGFCEFIISWMWKYGKFHHERVAILNENLYSILIQLCRNSYCIKFHSTFSLPFQWTTFYF